jgi:hypothetical protein
MLNRRERQGEHRGSDRGGRKDKSEDGSHLTFQRLQKMDTLWAMTGLFTLRHKSCGWLKEWTQGETERADTSPLMTF